MSKEAMELALEALEGLEALLLSMGLTHLIVYGDAEKAIIAIHEALAEQPAQPQEPVAWITKTGNVWKTKAYSTDIPLYTSQPAQRTWVGLTDDEIAKMPAWIYSPDQDGMTVEEGLETFARAIEAKLKEKNT